MIVCRDTASGIEVYLLRRSSRSTAVPDAYVFPGGTVSSSDRSPQAYSLTVGACRPAEPAFTVAAIRETFEECGVLFSVTPVAHDALREARRKVLDATCTFSECLIELDAKLDATAIRYFSRWITPPSVPHRFDARFFIARMPNDQVAEADANETFDGRWMRPSDALELARSEQVQMVFPTVKHLERVEQFATVTELLAFAETKTTVPVTPDVRNGGQFYLPTALENAW